MDAPLVSHVGRRVDCDQHRIDGFGTLGSLLKDGDLIAHTHQVQTELLLLRSILQNAETGQRSFLITAQDRFLGTVDRSDSEREKHKSAALLT